jgi:hypothetical protein
MGKLANNVILAPDLISQKIYFIRGMRIMFDADLAKLYAVSAKNLNRAVKRNANRFPADFMFQLKPKEARILRFQSGTSSQSSHGGRRYLPYAFTEQGIAMLSSVLRSERAVQVNIAIMRALLQLRAMLATHEDLRRKIDEMEKRYDAKFHAVFATLRQMLETPIPPKPQIGFHARTEATRNPKRIHV